MTQSDIGKEEQLELPYMISSYLKYLKFYCRSLANAFEKVRDTKSPNNNSYIKEWIEENEGLFVRAWFDEPYIESRESLFYLVSENKHLAGQFLYRNSDGYFEVGSFYSIVKDDPNTLKDFIFTKEDLKDMDLTGFKKLPAV